MIKKHVWEILLVVFFLMNNLYGKPQIIGSKVLSGDQFNHTEPNRRTPHPGFAAFFAVRFGGAISKRVAHAAH